MTTVTLELPDDLATQLQKLDLQTLISQLRQFFRFYSTELERPADDKFEFTILPPNPADDDFVLLPPVALPEPQYTMSLEERKQRLLAFSHDKVDDRPLEPSHEMILVPQVPLPEPIDNLSKEERKKRLLTISQWTEEEISEIEKAREYVNQWQPKAFF